METKQARGSRILPQPSHVGGLYSYPRVCRLNYSTRYHARRHHIGQEDAIFLVLVFQSRRRADYCGKPSIDPRPFGSTIRGLAAQAVFIKKGGRGEMTKAPISLQDLRGRLYVKAKAEPTWRFWGL